MATGTVAGQEKPGFTPPSTQELGLKFPQLEIIELIGRGGMGAVYKARQKELDRIVALKILPPGIGDDAAFAERFAREAKALARLNHPGIVTIHDFGRAEGLYFFVMEFVDGVNLRQLLTSARVSPREALAIVPQICDALQFAHDQGIVHRDIKPENILLDRRGRVKVADFGLAKLVESNAPLTPSLSPSDGERVAGRPGEGKTSAFTNAGKVMGTPAYMAPEQVEHPADVDHRADIYALGVVFYQMLTGELPGKPIEAPSSKVQIDVRLDEVVLRALERNPKLRYQQVSDVKTAVETVQTPVLDSLQPTQPLGASWEAARMRVQPLATTLIVLGTLGLFISMLVQVRGVASDSLHLGLGGFAYWRLFMPANCAAFLATIEPFIRTLNLVVLVGGLRMRRLQNYGLAIAGAVSAMVALPLLPIGLPVGVGALLVLVRKQVRSEFAASKIAGNSFPPASSPRFSKFAVVSAILAVISLFELWLEAGMAVLGARPHGADSAGWGWSTITTVVMCIQHWGFWGTVFLAGVALEDIHRATGRLKGAGIATFALLFMPLYWVLTHVFRLLADPVETRTDFAAIAFLANSAALVLCGGLAFWMHRNEVRRTVVGLTDSSSARRVLPKRVVRTLQWVATVLVVLDLYLGGFITHLTQRWTDLPDASLIAFYSHAKSHPKPDMESDIKRFSAALPSGQVTLLAVSDLSSPSPVCWRPDGTPLCRATNALAAITGNQSRSRFVALGLNLPSPTTGDQIIKFELQIGGRSVTSRHWSKSADGTFVFLYAPAGSSQLDFHIGEPNGEWQDTDAGWAWDGHLPRHAERVVRRSGQEAIVSLEQVNDQASAGTYVAWTSRSFPKVWVGRMVAVDEAGAVHEPIPRTTSLIDVAAVGWQFRSETFNKLSPSQIKEFRMQIRSCRWVEFRNVSLQPGYVTKVEIKDAGVE